MWSEVAGSWWQARGSPLAGRGRQQPGAAVPYLVPGPLVVARWQPRPRALASPPYPAAGRLSPRGELR